VIHGEQWEKFLARKFVGTKRFGLDGGESMIPALEAMIKYGGQAGVEEIVVGMAHRGRLNVLANVMGKPYRAIFNEFAGGSANPSDVGGSGDVKYHLGTSSDREFDGVKVHLSLQANPSHLEAVNPVVLGKARAVQVIKGDAEGDKVLPVLLHGDAGLRRPGAIVGSASASPACRDTASAAASTSSSTNQVGFTTSPQFARSSPYPSGRRQGHPGAHPARQRRRSEKRSPSPASSRTEFRQCFNRDIVIDMWCYAASATTRAMSRASRSLDVRRIRRQAADQQVYGDRLVAEGVVDQAWNDVVRTTSSRISSEFEAGAIYLPNKADWFRGSLGGPEAPRRAGRGTPQHGHRGERGRGSQGRRAADPRPERAFHPQDAGPHHRRQEGDVRQRRGLRLGHRRSARLRHPDRGRPQRPPVGPGQRPRHLQPAPCGVDRPADRRQVRASDHRRGRPFEVRDSPLSEFGVLGFEYGYSLADPRTLVLWEAQFGDFANGAQVIVDQFIASGEAKWLRASGLVMLLPHGFEGQGPEHSSARLERYLQLCAEDNIQVANVTTPANYFHLLRRQLLRDFRKPLVVMTPRACCGTSPPSRRSPTSRAKATSSASCPIWRHRRRARPGALSFARARSPTS
jgi:2-oxoglutarate dehydrogenase E1 component